MDSTGFARKLDAMGRIIIPARLREKMGMKIGETYELYTTYDEEGTRYICIKCPAISEKMLEEARTIVEMYNLKSKP